MKNIAIISIAIALIALGYMAMTSFNGYVKSNSVQACLSAAKNATTINQDPQVQTVTQPDGAWYETCMRDMGYRGSKLK